MFECISHFVRERRTKVGLTQAELSSILGYANGQFVSNLERGQCSIPRKKIKVLAKSLKVKPKEVVDVMVTDYKYRLEEAL